MRKVLARFARKNKTKKLYHEYELVEYLSFYGTRYSFYSVNLLLDDSGYHRSVRYFPERREQHQIHEDLNGELIQVKIRGRRKGKNLPDGWDDFQNSARNEKKSWKRNSKRKHQWKWE